MVNNSQSPLGRRSTYIAPSVLKLGSISSTAFGSSPGPDGATSPQFQPDPPPGSGPL